MQGSGECDRRGDRDGSAPSRSDRARRRPRHPHALHAAPRCCTSSGAGRSLHYPLAALRRDSAASRVVVVVGHQADAVRQAAESLGHRRTSGRCVQAEQRGTGHAVACAAAGCSKASSGDVLILYGDVPAHPDGDAAPPASSAIAPRGADLSAPDRALSTTRPATAGSCASPTAGCVGIVEERDATPAERAITRGQPRPLLRPGGVLLPRSRASAPTTRRASTT